MNIKKNFKDSFVFKYFNFLLILISGFLLIPFYIKNFSLELYGAWIIISAITSGLMLIDPGSTNLLIQQISKVIGRNKKSNLSTVIIPAMINSLIVASIIFLIGTIFGKLFMIWILDINILNNEMKIAFNYAIYAVVVTLLAQTLYGTIEGLQKNFFSGAVIVSGTIIKIISVVLLIKLNFGIKSLPLSDLISAITILLLFSSYILINFNFFFKKIIFRFKEYKRYTSLFLYGYFGRLSKILTNGGIDHLIIGKFIGLENVSIFYLAQSLPKKIESLISVLITSARPSLAYLSANYKNYNFIKLKLRLIYLTIMIILFLIYLLFDIINPFLSLWIGNHVLPAFYISLLIIILTSQKILTNSFNLILFSAGKIKEISKLQIIYSIILIPFLIFGTKFYGLYGLLIVHIVILLVTLTLFLSIMIFKNMYSNESIKKNIINEVLAIIIVTIVSFLIYKIIFHFINIHFIDWKIFTFIIIAKILIFSLTLYSISKNFRNEFTYILKRKKIMPLNKWRI